MDVLRRGLAKGFFPDRKAETIQVTVRMALDLRHTQLSRKPQRACSTALSSFVSFSKPCRRPNSAHRFQNV